MCWCHEQNKTRCFYFRQESENEMKRFLNDQFQKLECTELYLYETGCSRNLSVEVLLSLLLLDFKGETWAQDTL